MKGVKSAIVLSTNKSKAASHVAYVPAPAFKLSTSSIVAGPSPSKKLYVYASKVFKSTTDSAIWASI